METLRLSPNPGVGNLFTRKATFQDFEPEAALIGRAKKQTFKSLKPSVIFVMKTWQKYPSLALLLFTLKGKIEWLAEQKSSGRKSNDSFRTDQLCLLALACNTLMCRTL